MNTEPDIRRVLDLGVDIVISDQPDLAMLPIGGHFTMDPTGAALATELLGVRWVLPIHWGTFPLLAGTPGQLREAIEARGGSAEVIDWRPGDTID